MGGGLDKQKKLEEFEIKEFSNSTYLSYQQVADLLQYFKFISSLQKDDGIIDMNEFLQAVHLKQIPASSQLFQLFDLNQDQCLNFREFIQFFSNLACQNNEVLIEFSFNMMSCRNNTISPNNNNSKCISQEYLVQYLANIIDAIDEIIIPRIVIEKLVQQQFKDIIKRQEFEQKSLQNLMLQQEDSPQIVRNNDAFKFDDNQKEEIQEDHKENETHLIKLKNTYEEDKQVIDQEKSQLQKEELNQIIQINYNQYKQFIYQNPSILRWINSDLQRMSFIAHKYLRKR